MAVNKYLSWNTSEHRAVLIIIHLSYFIEPMLPVKAKVYDQ